MKQKPPLSAAKARQLVGQWAETGRVLAQLRLNELAHQTAEQSRKAAWDMLDLGGKLLTSPSGVVRTHSLHDEGVGDVQHDVQGGDPSDGTVAIVRGNGALIGLRQGCDLARFGEAAAPTHARRREK